MEKNKASVAKIKDIAWHQSSDHNILNHSTFVADEFLGVVFVFLTKCKQVVLHCLAFCMQSCVCLTGTLSAVCTGGPGRGGKEKEHQCEAVVGSDC